MRRTSSFLVMSSLAWGCASGGTGASSTSASVPVYEGAEAAPCRFEVIRTVRGQATIPLTASRETQERERDRILGREGARVGADAVVVPGPERVIGTAVVAIPGNQVPTTRTAEFQGDAVRFLEGCTAGR